MQSNMQSNMKIVVGIDYLIGFENFVHKQQQQKMK